MSRLARQRRRALGLARRAARRAARSGLARRVRGPRLSVVVPFYNVEAYLADCLDSILAQGYDDFEVILVDDGSPDGSREIAERYVAADRRLRLVTRPNGGLGAARNTGVREARGAFLTFVDSDDLLPPGALQALMGSALDTGSDIVVGAVDRFDSVRRWRPTWVDGVHADRRTAIRVEDHLPLLRNLYTWNKVYRKDFWDAQGLWFREGVAYEDQPIVTQLLARARTIDVIPDVVYEYRARDDKSSISQQTATLKDLRDRLAAWRVSHETFRRELSGTVYEGWLATLFDAHFHWYLTSRGTVDDDYWNELSDAVRFFADQAPQWIWDATEPAKRVLIELALRDRRADAQELVRQEHQKTEKWDAVVQDRGIRVLLPFHDDPDLDPDLFLLRPEQITLHHSVENAHWSVRDGRAHLHLTGWAYLDKVDLSRFPATTSVVLRDDRTGDEHVTAVTVHPRVTTPPPQEDLWCDYGPGTFAVDVPVEDVLDPHGTGAHGTGTDDTWTVLVRVEAGGFAVTTPVSWLLRLGAAGIIPAWPTAPHTRLVPEWAFRQPLRFRVDRGGAGVADVRLEGRRLTVRLVDGDHVDEVEASAGSDRAVGRVVEAPDGTRTATVDLPAVAAPAPGVELLWRVTGRAVDGAVVPLVVPGDSAVLHAGVDRRLVVGANRMRELVVAEWGLGASAEAVEVRPDGSLLVTGRVHGAADEVRLSSTGLKVGSEGPVAPVVDGRFTAGLDLGHQLLRFGRQPLPIGHHDLGVRVRRGDEWVSVPMVATASFAASLPLPVTTDVHEGSVVRGPQGGVRLTLVRPIGEARGRYRQHRLRQSPPRTGGLTRGILFRSYFGEQVTDNGLSIQRELQRRGSDLPVYWAVQDHSIPVPDGSVPVVVNSREWYQLLGSVRYYVDNMYQPEYHHKPDGQVLVQTFHGYPFKVMGHTHWRQQQFSQARIAAYDARAAEWDHLVSPARYATPLLRREFAYDGDVLEIGYPRNDVLQSDRAGRLREVVRDSLGIRPDQTAVLYAPTFRDYLAEEDSRAVMADFFDFAEAHRRLGDDHVILIRGHAFNARVAKRAGSRPGCLDVTDYPEVSDLYLAADAAIVDYSSLRFDFGVTGKPMVFHVPDLERYQQTRGWLFDFEPTAPGPLLETTAQVADALTDLEGLRTRYAAAHEKFRADYLDLEDGQAGRRFVDAVIAPRGDA